MQVAVGEDHEPAILRPGVFAGLFLADERALVFGFGLKDNEREASAVEKQKIDEALGGFLEVVAQCVDIR